MLSIKNAFAHKNALDLANFRRLAANRSIYIYFSLWISVFFFYMAGILLTVTFFFTKPAELTNNAPTTFICCFCWCLLAFNPSSFVVVVGFDC